MFRSHYDDAAHTHHKVGWLLGRPYFGNAMSSVITGQTIFGCITTCDCA